MKEPWQTPSVYRECYPWIQFYFVNLLFQRIGYSSKMKNTRLSTPRNMSVRLRRKAARAVVAVAMAVPFLLPFAACGPTAADRALDRAEALMEERPDSA